MLFTVFTPTYNRSGTLERVYESLLSQSYRDFEWLVVDDGSTDDTAAIIRGWQNSAPAWFSIRYFWQENQHKKAAHNLAVRQARGQLFRIVDSDDQCPSQMLARIAHYWYSIGEERRNEYVGVCGLCAYPDGSIVGDRFPTDEWIDSNALEMHYRFSIAGDKAGAMRTDVLKEYQFPENVKGYVPEGVAWSRIARKFKTRFVNEVFLVVHLDQQGIGTREWAAPNPTSVAGGMVFEKRRLLSEDLDYFVYCPILFALEAARLTRFYIHYLLGRPSSSMRYWPSAWLGRVLVTATIPLGLIMWARDTWLWRLRKS